MKEHDRKRKHPKQLSKKRRKKRLIRLLLIFLLIFLSFTSGILASFGVRYVYQAYFSRADIVLDAGHGGKDPGANTEDVIEKDITLQITKMTKDILEDAGYKVAITRDDDSFMELKERAAFANQKKAAIFVSIHCNSAEDGIGNGIETYYTEQKGVSNENLANEIQNALMKHTNANNREVRTADYTVLARTSMPAALVEVGFLTDDSERALLQQEVYQEKLANGIADGILSYYSAN